jgi:hypothetical protein
MSSFGPPELRQIGGCHARSSLRAPRTFRDAARTSRLVCRRRYSHIEGRRLLAGLGSAAASGAPGTPLLARTRALSSLALWIGEPPPPTWEPPPLFRIEESPPPHVEVGEPRPPQPPHVEVGEPRPPQPLAGGPPPRELSGNRRRRTHYR